MSNSGTGNDHFVPRTVLCLLPIMVWALHFGLVYGGAHVACAVESEDLSGRLTDLLVLGATGLALAIIAVTGLGAAMWLKLFARSSQGHELSGFLAGVIRTLAVLSFAGVLWAGAAALFLPPCAIR